jgi:hypothetical protein
MSNDEGGSVEALAQDQIAGLLQLAGKICTLI